MAGYSVTYSVVDNATKQIDAINRRVAAMRAPMERLSKQVSRFMDVSGLNTIAKGFASIGRAAVSVVRTLAEMIPLLGTITGAATIAGMAKLVGSYADWSQQLTATADNLGMTTQQLQQFEDATRLAGGKSSDMDAALKALYKTQTDFVRGQASADQIGWLNRLGISVKDANGNLRTMADLMPEVVRKIGEIKNPADRAAASAALLGDANDTLVETFRRSHQSFGQWMTDASKYTELSDKQKDQLQAFSEAQGHIATAFDHLGQQISATLATNFTPLLNTLADFVEKNQPAIIAAVDHISDEFKNWTAGSTGNKSRKTSRVSRRCFASCSTSRKRSARRSKRRCSCSDWSIASSRRKTSFKIRRSMLNWTPNSRKWSASRSGSAKKTMPRGNSRNRGRASPRTP
jgi:ABC-type transporter Mla subunit MlaD